MEDTTQPTEQKQRPIYSTIRLPVEEIDRLKAMKQHPKEQLYSVISRLLDAYNGSA